MYLKGICFQNIPQLCGCACESNKLILNASRKQKRELFSVHLSRTTKKKLYYRICIDPRNLQRRDSARDRTQIYRFRWPYFQLKNLCMKQCFKHNKKYLY